MANLGIADQIKSSFESAGLDQLASIGAPSKNSVTASEAPWYKLPQNRFFAAIKIDPKRWDQFFPYRLLVIDTKKKNSVVQGAGGNNVQISLFTSELSLKGGKGATTIDFIPLGNQWIFQLPISPQQLSIQDQFAINTSATLRGIVEEHSGIRFKIISAQGTMGVWPFRESVDKPPTSPTPLQSIFGGTIEAFGALTDQVSRVINSATSGHPANKPVTISPELSTAGELSTGYYHAMALQQFLEQYAEAKKDPNNAGWRLVFDIPKQNQSFIVTPTLFNWLQNVNKPMEINYALQFKAWRRIDLQNKPKIVDPDVNRVSPGILQRILNTITEARKTTSAAINLIGAVRSDVETPLDILRQTSLLVKDLAGVAVTAADLPFQVQRDYASGIKDALKNLDISTVSASDSATRKSLLSIKSSSANNEGLSLAAVSAGQLGAGRATSQSIDPSNNVFQNPEQNFALMDLVPVYSMTLNNVQQNNLNNILDDARSLTVDDLKKFRFTMKELAIQLSNKFGAGDAFYNKIYGRSTPTNRIQPMTLDEYDILKTLYETIQSYDILTATTDIDDANKKTNMEYVAGLAETAGIDFQTSASKVFAPVPFGLTVEEIAMRYLGDAQRWLEIVTLNNLRNPYIDENGFKLALLSNATGRQVTVSSDENLYVGQRIILSSRTQVQSARRILGIDRLSDTSFLLTLDGEANLDGFVTGDGAYVQAYLPGTVNSQQKIFIPSDLPVSANDSIIIPASTASDPLVGLSKVDWLLTDSGDLAVNNYGDFRYSAGITNIVQALKIKFGTEKGKSLLHPEFGLGIRSGMMNSDVNVQEIYNSISRLIEDDPRFSSVQSLQIQLDGGKLTISLSVSLSGAQGVFPVTFQLSA